MFGRSLLEPSYSRLPTWQGSELNLAKTDFACASCNARVPVSISALVAGVLDWERQLGGELSVAAGRHFDLGVVRRSKDGGWPAMIRVRCKACDAWYLVYAGVDETSNSVWTVTLQGIVELTV